MTETLILNPTSHHFQFDQTSSSQGPNQVQLNQTQGRLDPEQLDHLLLEQLKELTQKIVDAAALQQIQSSQSTEKHDANGAHEHTSSGSALDLTGVVASK